MNVVSLFLIAVLIRIYFVVIGKPHEAFYYNSLARMDSIAAGAFLAVNVYSFQKLNKNWLSLGFSSFLLLIVLSAFFFKTLDHNSILFATVGYSVSAVFFMVICNNALYRLNYITKSPWLQFVGRISYGVYVYHLPVFLVCSAITAKTLHIHWPILNSFISIIITFGLSLLSYHLFELPLLRLRSKFL